MFRTIFTTLRALLKSGLCATQLCIRSDTASYGHHDHHDHQDRQENQDTRHRQDRQVGKNREDRQIWRLNLIFQVTCVWTMDIGPWTAEMSKKCVKLEIIWSGNQQNQKTTLNPNLLSKIGLACLSSLHVASRCPSPGFSRWTKKVSLIELRQNLRQSWREGAKAKLEQLSGCRRR